MRFALVVDIPDEQLQSDYNALRKDGYEGELSDFLREQREEAAKYLRGWWDTEGSSITVAHESDGIPRVKSVVREPDGPILRASIGGNHDLGFYLVFRGDPGEILAMLRDALVSAAVLLPAGFYDDRRGAPG